MATSLPPEHKQMNTMEVSISKFWLIVRYLRKIAWGITYGMLVHPNRHCLIIRFSFITLLEEKFDLRFRSLCTFCSLVSHFCFQLYINNYSDNKTELLLWLLCNQWTRPRPNMYQFPSCLPNSSNVVSNLTTFTRQRYVSISLSINTV